MPSATRPSLSANDTSVLSTLFDPESSPSANSTALILPSLPPLPNIPPSCLPALQKRELAAILPLNNASPSPEALAASIASLRDLLEAEPGYAPAWNNRAQALRMLHGDLGLATADILADLAKAIALAAPESPSAAVSPLQAKVLAGAHSQYAHVLYKLSRRDKRPADLNPRGQGGQDQTLPEIALPESLCGRSDEELEEMASRHFAMGGRYGNELAREMAVRTNPYAKLCGSIVKGALMEEVRGGLKPRVEVEME
jgi:hypothetical protein